MTNTTSPTNTQQAAVPKHIREALSEVLDFMWDSEYADFDSSPNQDHIFIQLCILKGWLGEQACPTDNEASATA